MESDDDRVARAFIEALPPSAVLRVFVSSDGHRYVVTYKSKWLPITRAYRDELLASGRAVEGE